MSPSRRIVGAAAASSVEAQRATDRGCVVFAIRCAPMPAAEPQDGRRPEQVRLEPVETLLQLAEERERRLAVGAGDEDRDEVTVRRVAEHLAPLELTGEEPRDVVVDGVPQRRRVGLERLDEDAPGGVAAAAPGELRDELERPLLGPEVRQREARVGVDDRRELDARGGGGPSRRSACRRGRRAPPPRTARASRGRRRAGRTSASSRNRSSSGSRRSSSDSSRCVPAPIRARSTEPQAGHCFGTGSGARSGGSGARRRGAA